MSKLPNRYWTRRDLKDLKRAKTYLELKDIALRILKRMPQPISQACGPISTGGLGNLRDNLRIFALVVRRLEEGGNNVFNQLPFEAPMHRIRRQHGGKYDKNLLKDFYLGIFESDLIQILYFMPTWKTSYGARWEHRQAKRLGITVIYLLPDFLPEFTKKKPRL